MKRCRPRCLRTFMYRLGRLDSSWVLRDTVASPAATPSGSLDTVPMRGSCCPSAAMLRETLASLHRGLQPPRGEIDPSGEGLMANPRERVLVFRFVPCHRNGLACRGEVGALRQKEAQASSTRPDKIFRPPHPTTAYADCFSIQSSLYPGRWAPTTAQQARPARRPRGNWSAPHSRPWLSMSRGQKRSRKGRGVPSYPSSPAGQQPLATAGPAKTTAPDDSDSDTAGVDIGFLAKGQQAAFPAWHQARGTVLALELANTSVEDLTAARGSSAAAAAVLHTSLQHAVMHCEHQAMALRTAAAQLEAAKATMAALRDRLQVQKVKHGSTLRASGATAAARSTTPR